MQTTFFSHDRMRLHKSGVAAGNAMQERAPGRKPRGEPAMGNRGRDSMREPQSGTWIRPSVE
jgi:hypothetical protein